MLKSLRINLFSLFLALLFVGNAYAVPINTSATVLTAIAVTEGTALNFGSFTVGVGGGVIDFDADGAAISTSGDVDLLGGEVAGVANLNTAASGAVTITVTVIGTQLDSGGNNMTLVGNCQGNGGALGADNGDCTYTSQELAVDAVAIGGKLTVGSNQPAGAYTGTLDVIANF